MDTLYRAEVMQAVNEELKDKEYTHRTYALYMLKKLYEDSIDGDGEACFSTRYGLCGACIHLRINYSLSELWIKKPFLAAISGRTWWWKPVCYGINDKERMKLKMKRLNAIKKAITKLEKYKHEIYFGDVNYNNI